MLQKSGKIRRNRLGDCGKEEETYILGRRIHTYDMQSSLGEEDDSNFQEVSRYK